jgi:hypothetical protein
VKLLVHAGPALARRQAPHALVITAPAVVPFATAIVFKIG